MTTIYADDIDARDVFWTLDDQLMRASHATNPHSYRIFFRLTISVSTLVTCPTQRRGKMDISRTCGCHTSGARPFVHSSYLAVAGT